MKASKGKVLPLEWDNPMPQDRLHYSWTAGDDEKLNKNMRLTVAGKDTTNTSCNMENLDWIQELIGYNKMCSL